MTFELNLEVFRNRNTTIINLSLFCNFCNSIQKISLHQQMLRTIIGKNITIISVQYTGFVRYLPLKLLVEKFAP